MLILNKDKENPEVADFASLIFHDNYIVLLRNHFQALEVMLKEIAKVRYFFIFKIGLIGIWLSTKILH